MIVAPAWMLTRRKWRVEVGVEGSKWQLAHTSKESMFMSMRKVELASSESQDSIAGDGVQGLSTSFTREGCIMMR